MWASSHFECMATRLQPNGPFKDHHFLSGGTSAPLFANASVSMSRVSLRRGCSSYMGIYYLGVSGSGDLVFKGS